VAGLLPGEKIAKLSGNTAHARTANSREDLKVAEEKPTIPNEISDETGQYDARFLLWRKFCADQGIPVETLPSDLNGDIKEQWEKLKAARLKSGDK
jgi:hypothetical protein